MSTRRQDEQHKLFLHRGTLERTRINLMNILVDVPHPRDQDKLMAAVETISLLIVDNMRKMRTISTRIPSGK